jgi:D-sedoheptulose 7-phosphate isomerase
VAESLERELDEHLTVAEATRALLPEVDEVASLLVERFAAERRLYTLGNGGSSLDAQHLAEELVGRFKRDRRPLPAQSLAADTAAVTCIANDYSFDEIFERQVRAFAQRNDVVAAFTTSERSPNVVRGLAAARELGATTVLFGGGSCGPAREHADHALVVPSESTARIQELHVFLLHVLLERIDAWAAGA